MDNYKKNTEKGDRINMCKAWDDHMERGRREGREEGKREGRYEEKAENLQCIMKNLKVTIQQAMDILEIPAEEVAICLINGFHSKLDAQVKDEDVLAIFPPVGGG